MKKVILSLVMVFAIITLFAACGGTPEKQGNEKNNDVTPNVTETNATEGVDLSKVVIVTEDYPPTNYLNENGELVGSATEAVKVALEKLELDESIIKVYDWSKTYDMALNDENTLIYTINRTPEREELFKWIKPVSYDNVYMYRMKNRPEIKITSLEDAKSYKMAVVTQDFIEQGLLGEGFEADKNAISYPSQRAAMDAVFEGKADAFLVATDLASVAKLLEGTAFTLDDLEMVYKVEELTSVGYLAASLKTSDEIVDKFMEAMPVVENK